MANRALVIGSQTGILTGVENDAHNVAAFLEKREFKVDLRVKGKADREGILQGYKALIEGVGSSDAAVVYYSGHGNFTVSSNPASQERLQDIVPFDYGDSSSDDYRGISSNELSINLRRLMTKTRNATVILDCCHSAQMSRDGAARDAVARALPHPLYADLARYREKLEELYPGELAKLGTEGNPDAVRIVACAQSELANEYTNAKNVRTGAFTEALLELFAEVGDAPVSWAVLGPAIRERVLRRFSTQRPDFDGRVGRRPFTLNELPQSDAVTIALRDDTWQIDAGAVHAVNRGDKYKVVAFGAQNQAVAEAIVTSTGATTASVDLTWTTAGDEKLPDNAIAIPIERAAVTRPVTVIAPDELRPRIAELIEQTRTLREATADDKDRTVATLRIADDRLTIEDAYGPLFPPADPASLAEAVTNVKNLGVAQALRELEGEHGVYAHELEIEWGVIEAGTPQRLPDKGTALGLGDRIYCRVKSNAQQRRLYIHIFNIGLRGKVTLLTPWAPGGIELDHGKETFLGEAFDRSRPGLELSWPAGLPKATFPRLDTLLVIATAKPANLIGLQTQEVAMRSAARTVKGSALEQLLGQLQSGATREVTREIGGPTAIDGHFAKQLTYLLHPRNGKMTSPDFRIDDAQGAKGTARATAAWRAPTSTPPRRVAIRLDALDVADKAPWSAGDVRVDALICTRPSEGEPGFWSQTRRRTRTGDGRHGPLDNALLYDGPVRDFLDIYLWVSSETTPGPDLSALLASRANDAAVKDALAALRASAGATSPWITAVGAGAVLARASYDAIRTASGSPIGLYRTSFLVEEQYGAGRHPRQGLHSADDVSFSLVVT
jgi:hypothetical protein